MDGLLRENEHIETVSDRLRLIVSTRHTFGTDALLLAAFAFPKPRETACDLGTGCGIIPFYWLARGVGSACAVELQEAAVDQLARSVTLSGIEDRIRILRADLRELKGLLPEGGFDLVSMNPPYTKAGHGIQSASDADRVARHETEATLEEICAAAAKLLKFGGRFCLCLRPERLTDAMLTMHNAGLEPKRLRFVSKNVSAAPWLFLLEGKKGRAPGLTVEPPLFLYDMNGTETREYLEMTAVYRKD